MPAPAPLLSGINFDEGLKVLQCLILRLKPVSGLDFDEQKPRRAGLDPAPIFAAEAYRHD